jgi:GT2 family glycosyltransferase
MRQTEVTVVVATLNRPDCLERCLTALEDPSNMPSQIIVVDASDNDRSRCVMDAFPRIRYIAAPELFGALSASRNRALLEARGEIIAFLDDDAYAHTGWLEHLLEAYAEANVGGVGGRARNGQRGEEKAPAVGVLERNGYLTGNFACDPGGIVDVDHVMGCNMSFRREVLERLGGFREDYNGISGLCEDSDLCLRVKALGYRLRFQPAACVDHEGAPQAKGNRFNTTYQFYSRRNNSMMLIRNFGFSPVLWRFPAAIAVQSVRDLVRGVGRALAHFAGSLAGLFSGMVYGLWFYLKEGADPVRRDAPAEAIRNALRAQAALAASDRSEGR